MCCGCSWPLKFWTFSAGSNIAVVKETEFSLDPASFSVGRFVIAALVFTPFLKDAFKQPAVVKAGIELGVWSSIAYLSQSVGLMTTDAGRVSFFTTFSVQFCSLLVQNKSDYSQAACHASYSCFLIFSRS